MSNSSGLRLRCRWWRRHRLGCRLSISPRVLNSVDMSEVVVAFSGITPWRRIPIGSRWLLFRGCLGCGSSLGLTFFLLLNFSVCMKRRLLGSIEFTREVVPNAVHFHLSRSNGLLLFLDVLIILLTVTARSSSTGIAPGSRVALIPLRLIPLELLALASELVSLLEELAEQVHDVFEWMVRDIILIFPARTSQNAHGFVHRISLLLRVAVEQ